MVCVPLLLTPLNFGAPGARWEGRTADPVRWKCWDWRGNGTKRGIPQNPQLLAGLLLSPFCMKRGGDTHGSLWSHPAMKGSKWILQCACRREGKGTPSSHLPHPRAASHTHSCSISASPLTSAPCTHVCAHTWPHHTRLGAPAVLTAPGGAHPAALLRSAQAQHTALPLSHSAHTQPVHSYTFYTLVPPRPPAAPLSPHDAVHHQHVAQQPHHAHHRVQRGDDDGDQDGRGVFGPRRSRLIAAGSGQDIPCCAVIPHRERLRGQFRVRLHAPQRPHRAVPTPRVRVPLPTGAAASRCLLIGPPCAPSHVGPGAALPPSATSSRTLPGSLPASQTPPSTNLLPSAAAHPSPRSLLHPGPCRPHLDPCRAPTPWPCCLRPRSLHHLVPPGPPPAPAASPPLPAEPPQLLPVAPSHSLLPSSEVIEGLRTSRGVSGLGDIGFGANCDTDPAFFCLEEGGGVGGGGRRGEGMGWGGQTAPAPTGKLGAPIWDRGCTWEQGSKWCWRSEWDWGCKRDRGSKWERGCRWDQGSKWCQSSEWDQGSKWDRCSNRSGNPMGCAGGPLLLSWGVRNPRGQRDGGTPHRPAVVQLVFLGIFAPPRALLVVGRTRGRNSTSPHTPQLSGCFGVCGKGIEELRSR